MVVASNAKELAMAAAVKVATMVVDGIRRSGSQCLARPCANCEV